MLPTPSHFAAILQDREVFGDWLASVEGFNDPWRGMDLSENFPRFTWQAIERQLTDLTPAPACRTLIHYVCAGDRRLAGFKLAALSLTELLELAKVTLVAANPGSEA